MEWISEVQQWGCDLLCINIIKHGKRWRSRRKEEEIKRHSQFNRERDGEGLKEVFPKQRRNIVNTHIFYSVCSFCFGGGTSNSYSRRRLYFDHENIANEENRRERETQNYWHMSNLDRNYRINCDILGNARARALILVSLRKRRAVQIGNNLTLAEKGRLLKLW